MFRYAIVLLSCLVLQYQCYGPISKNPAPAPSSISENSVLNFASADYGYAKPVAVPENTKPAGGYWWLNKKSPFAGPEESPINDLSSGKNKDETNPLFINDGPCGGYSCVPCSEEGFVCARKHLCRNGVISRNQLNLVGAQNKFCYSEEETCCKVSDQCEGNGCYSPKGYPQPVAVVPSYSQPSPVVVPEPSYSQPPPAVSIVPSTGYVKPEYGSSIAPTSAPSVAPYTGPQNTTPYPGCAAALKCVPDNYCTLEGVMSDIPVLLTRELLESRVPLSECIDLSTGIIGKCCRDPNYKDPWPDHDTHDHGDHGDHGHDHSHEHTEAPQTHYTIKKPIGGYQTKPDSFPPNVQQPTTHKVVSLSNYSPPTEAPKPIPTYSGSASSNGYEYGSPSSYVPSPSSQVYIPPSPSYSTYAPVPQPVPTYAPSSIPSYVAPTQPPQVVPSYTPSTYPPQSVPVASYVPPQKPQSVAYVPPPKPVASYVPPPPPQPVAAYVPPPQPQPAASYVPPQPPQPVGNSYYQAPTITLTRQPLEPPLVIASDRVFEKSTIPPIVVQQEYAQCGVKASDGTEFGEAPWHAVVSSIRNKDLSCGGAVVSENAVLTSAHCLEKSDTESLYVQVGPATKTHKVIAVVRHPQYDSSSLSKDLALAILKEPIKFDSHTQKICLPPPQSQIQSQNKECYVSTQTDYFNPGTVQKLKIQTFPYKDCEVRLRNTYLGKYFILQDTFTCASTLTEAELCQAKSGEPLVCDRGDGIFELYGIKSWDLGCQEYKKSAIFSNNDVLWVENSLVAPLEKLLTIEQIYQKEKFKGETLEGVNIQEKPGFGLGYGK